METQGRIVRLNDCVRHLRRRRSVRWLLQHTDRHFTHLGRGEDGPGSEHAIGEFPGQRVRELLRRTFVALYSLAKLGQKVGAKARASATTQTVDQLEALKHVCLFCLLSRHIHDAVHQLGALCIVALGKVVPGARLRV